MRGHTALAVLGLAQRLRDHGLQRLGEHGAHHFLFLGRKHVDDTVDGLGRRRGVQRAEHQVTGFGRRHGQADGFQVSHFANQNRVRVFTQRGLQRCRERQRHGADFALVDQAFLGLVHEFDGVFHRQDMAVLGLVEVVDHGRQRGGLARAGGAGHQHQAARLQGQLAKDLGGVELLQRQDLAGNGTEHGRRAAVLVEGIDTKTGQAFDLERKVHFQKLFVLLALGIAHDVVDHGVHGLVVQRIDVDATHIAVDANHGGQACRQMQVRSLVLDTECQQLRDIHGDPSLV